MNRKTQPPSVAGGFKIFQKNFGRAALLKFTLIFFVGGFCCLPTRAADTNSAVIPTPPPPEWGSIQWEINRQWIKEHQESYRKHLVIPDATNRDVPRIHSLNAPDLNAKAAVGNQAPLISPATFRALLFFAIVFALVGFLIFRTLPLPVRRKLNRRFNPWNNEPELARVFQGNVRAEEESVARFLATFHAGPSATTPASPLDKEVQFKEFCAQAAGLAGRQRRLLEEISLEPSGQSRQKLLARLRAEVNALKDAANFPEVLPVWQAASALDGLLKQLVEKLGNVTPSALRTVAGGVDLLDDLCRSELPPQLLLAEHPLKFLVVDDNLISRLALSLALKKTFSQPDLAVAGEEALALAGQQAYDVIFLDVQMPGMDGFELCVKIRETALNRNTPVVFVTGQDDFDARAQSTLSGGNDLMGKPFLTFEITVKAFTLALQGRLHGRAAKPAQNFEPGRGTAEVLPKIAEATRPLGGSAASIRPLASTASKGENKKLAQAFLKRAAEHIGPLREICRKLTAADDDDARQTLLVDGFLRINSLISQTTEELIHPAHQMSVALDGLFRKLLENAKHSSVSTLATITAAVELLQDLCAPGMKAELAVNPPISLLVVDDDLVARRAITGALQTAFNRPDSAENGEAALALAAEKPFDVIFLDVVMPGLDGFETCSKIRGTIVNRTTPVIFVTGKNDAETRSAMTHSSGNELLGKPFLVSEITVKALTFALRGRLRQAGQ
jgi:CheY-like chemotaxis protein